MSRTAVVAFGGNALVTDAEHESIPDQYQTVARTVPHLEHVSPQLNRWGSMGSRGVWIGDSTGIDSPLGGGRCRRPILLIFEVG